MLLAYTCWGKLLLTWKGPLAFYDDDVDSVPTSLGGVYVLCAFTPRSPTLVPFYVGQSGCLHRRLTEHLVGAKTFAKHLRRRLPTYFTIAVVSNPFVRTAVEAALIRLLSPAGNSVVPDAPIVVVNPPPLSLLDP